MPTESWTRVLFEAIDDAVFVHDEKGNILDANPAACRRLGYTRDEMLRLTTRDIDAPEFADGFTERLESQLHTGNMLCEGVHRTKDGRRIAVDINTSSFVLGGKPAILAVMRDITQRKQIEEDLAKKSHLLQSILDQMSDAIIVADAEERIILFNPSADRMFGPALAQGLFTLQVNDRTSELSPLPMGRCLRGETFDGLEFFVRHEEAPRGLWISIAGRPLIDHGGGLAGGVLVCHDITNRKRDENRLHAQYELARVIAEDRDFAGSAREILQILCDALDFEAAVLWSPDHDNKLLCCRETWRRTNRELDDFLNDSRQCEFTATSDLVGAVWREGEARLHRLTETAWASLPRWQSARKAGLRGVLALPICSGSATVGVLELWIHWIDERDESLFSLLQAMANQIGQFLNRQRVEKDLRDSRAVYESLVESLPQNIFRKDAAGRVTFGNQRYCATMGKPLSALLGKTDFDLFPAELAEKYVHDDRQLMSTGQTVDTIEAHQTPDGSRLYVHVVKTAVRNSDNEVVGVQGIFWDVTQEVRANKAIAASEKRYRQLTEATLDGIVVIDAKGRITLFNPAAEQMFGYTSAEVVGASPDLLVPAEFQESHDDGVSPFLATRMYELLGKPHEFKGRRKDGAIFPVEIALSMLADAIAGSNHDGAPIQILAAIRDLTERNKMRAVLIQNEKLASIGLLSAGVAHEINNPLAFVANNLVVLERDCKGLLDLETMYESAQASIAQAHPELASRIQALTEKIDMPYVKDNLARILSRTRDGIDRVTRIVHSLRGMARTEAPHRQDIRLPDLVNSSLEILHGKFKRLGVIVEQIYDERPIISGVPTQISQVVLNLLVNAFQAIEAAGRAEGKIVVRCHRAGTDMIVEIQDNGAGIKPEHSARLFDPFFTTKDVGEGTGLGLSISHHIITAHGGRIEVDSQPGEGTCFRLYLPLKTPRNKP